MGTGSLHLKGELCDVNAAGAFKAQVTGTSDLDSLMHQP